ncbi:MAG: hypothetical protein KAH21_01110, partial [Spirochaetaceae bacterium]|nr:hypothetical protein [Spirochaetaceae bacterium]
GWVSGEELCGRELALRLKREGEYSRAAVIWEKLNLRGQDYFSAVELAKYYEHRLKEPEAAIEVLSGLEDLSLTLRRRKELIHRRCRLERKLEKKDSGLSGTSSV